MLWPHKCVAHWFVIVHIKLLSFICSGRDAKLLFLCRANKYDGGAVTTLKERLSSRPYDIVAYSTRKQQDCSGYNPCERWKNFFGLSVFTCVRFMTSLQLYAENETSVVNFYTTFLVIKNCILCWPFELSLQKQILIFLKIISRVPLVLQNKRPEFSEKCDQHRKKVLLHKHKAFAWQKILVLDHHFGYRPFQMI